MKLLTKMMTLGLTLALSLALLGGCTAKPAVDSGTTPTPSPSAQLSKLKILDTEYAMEDYAICIAKDNTQLLADVNAALATIKENGTAQAIVDKYISGVAHTLDLQKDAEDKPELVMATNATFPPYEFMENQKIVGIDAEIAAAIADQLGMKLTIMDMEFGSIIAAVQSGKVDLGMAGMTVTEERQQSVSFSDSYATGIQSIIVAQDSPITAPGDLTGEGVGYLVGVQQDTTGDIYATDDFGDARVLRFNKGTDAVQALLTGKVDCVIIDNEPAKAFVAAS